MTQEKFTSSIIQRRNLMCVLLKTARDPQQFIEDSRQKDLQLYDDGVAYLVEWFYDTIAIDFKYGILEETA